MAKEQPMRYVLSNIGLCPPAPFALVTALEKGEAAIIEFEEGVGAKRARDFLDGLAMLLATVTGESLENKFMVEGRDGDGAEI